MIKDEVTEVEPIILAIDTSSKTTSLAVTRGEALLATTLHPPDQTRSETLWVEVTRLLAELGMSIRDVDMFSVCTGPGGFTGLRVGMAAVMGFSVATAKPLIGITSLEAAAFAAAPAKNVCAIVNAYKGEVYSQVFGFEGDGVPIALNEPMVSTLEKALDRCRLQHQTATSNEVGMQNASSPAAGVRLQHQTPTSNEVGMQNASSPAAGVMLQHQTPTSNEVGMQNASSPAAGVADKNDLVLAGDGAKALADEMGNIAAGRVGWIVKRPERGLAAAVARLSFLKHRRGETQSVESVRASYVRASEAEIKLSLGLLGSKIKRSMSQE